jgi:DNA invertase Pin-like site-specific DNA recombinase
MEAQQKLKYCLYARKSSESDERQAMSIDSQIKEMSALAVKEQLQIVDIKQESHSAKISGARPLFVEMLSDLNNDKYNAILTWAPDRLSRNAGDLGSLVDLIDQKKLLRIRTISQSFSDNPAEKFLLMILCSQAKLENDNRGLNVKRGIRTKCEMGWRPCPAPLGYINYSHAGTKKVMVDKEIAPKVKELFELVAEAGYSGRDLKRMIDREGIFKRHTGRQVPLSMIYRILKSSFYYGRFEYPEGSGNWYTGAHEPLITKELFDKVQKKLQVPIRPKWGEKYFLFKDLFKCAYCGASIVAEEKFKIQNNGNKHRYIYYHCSKKLDSTCPEQYVTESILRDELVNYVIFAEKKHLGTLVLNSEIKKNMERFRKVKNEVLIEHKIENVSKNLKYSDYFKYTIFNGTKEEKEIVLTGLKTPLFIHNKSILSQPLS